MSKAVRVLLAAGAIAGIGTLWGARADETSTTDKLRILYSNRLTFTDDGTPLVTVEIMSGRTEVRISAAHGVLVRPDGAGASEIQGDAKWTVTLANGQPAQIR